MSITKPTGIEAIVCEDIAKRQKRGMEKYGTTVAENPLALKEWLTHAYEETLDAAVYLRRAIADIEEQKHSVDNVSQSATLRAGKESQE